MDSVYFLIRSMGKRGHPTFLTVALEKRDEKKSDWNFIFTFIFCIADTDGVPTLWRRSRHVTRTVVSGFFHSVIQMPLCRYSLDQ